MARYLVLRTFNISVGQRVKSLDPVPNAQCTVSRTFKQQNNYIRYDVRNYDQKKIKTLAKTRETNNIIVAVALL